MPCDVWLVFWVPDSVVGAAEASRLNFPVGSVVLPLYQSNPPTARIRLQTGRTGVLLLIGHGDGTEEKQHS